MAFSTYSDLITQLQNWLGRPQDQSLPPGTTYDDFVAMFEADASTKLRTHFQEVAANIVTVGGTSTYALPNDFLEAREVSITSTDPVRVLLYMPPGSLDQEFQNDDASDADDVNDDAEDEDEPIAYTLEGFNIRFNPIPDGAYTIKVAYYQKITPLSQSVNWLYQNYQSIYLYGSLIEAETFLGANASDARMQDLMQRRDQLYQQILLSDRKFRVGAAPLRIRLPFNIWEERF